MNLPLSRQIDSIIAGAIERRVFPGAVVLIARGGQLLHCAAYGATMYDAPEARTVWPDTIYDVASLTKVFTATAALRLSEAGLLDLRGPVSAYLPEFQPPAVTVWHLLTHTSGLDIRLSALRRAGRRGIFDAACRPALAHPPGAHVAYTNVNSLLLGEIVARVSGAPLDTALRELVLGPLGLRDTTFCPPAALLQRIAPTEIDDEWRRSLVHGTVHDESAHALGGVAGHAGLFSTAEDLYTFCRSWLEDDRSNVQTFKRSNVRPASYIRLLCHETIVLATSNHTAGLNAACGLGWMLDRPTFMGATPLGSFGHTGFTGPAIVVVPQHRLIVVVLSNRVYPRRGKPEHHAVTAAILNATTAAADESVFR
jgi:CubicO group peptidase (beta-lactamase class C family)